MVRVKRGNIAVKRRKVYKNLAKGYAGAHSALSTMASEQIIQSLNFAYIGRRLKKRTFRRIWIYRINVASRARMNTYSIFFGDLRNSNIFLNNSVSLRSSTLIFPYF